MDGNLIVNLESNIFNEHLPPPEFVKKRVKKKVKPENEDWCPLQRKKLDDTAEKRENY